jgi:hypothetical protein
VWSGNAADGLFIANGGGNGVHGITTAGSSSGVMGETFGGAGTYGVFGRTDSPAGYAGYFDGPLFSTGILQMGLPTEFSAFRFGPPPPATTSFRTRDMEFQRVRHRRRPERIVRLPVAAGTPTGSTRRSRRI